MKVFFRGKNPGEEHAKKEEAGTSTCVLQNSMGILKLKPFCLDFFLTYLEVKKVKESVEWRQGGFTSWRIGSQVGMQTSRGQKRWWKKSALLVLWANLSTNTQNISFTIFQRCDVTIFIQLFVIVTLSYLITTWLHVWLPWLQRCMYMCVYKWILWFINETWRWFSSIYLISLSCWIYL